MFYEGSSDIEMNSKRELERVEKELDSFMESLWGKRCVVDGDCADTIAQCDRSQGFLAETSRSLIASSLIGKDITEIL